GRVAAGTSAWSPPRPAGWLQDLSPWSLIIRGRLKKMNIANKLTMGRILIIPFFMGCLLISNTTDDINYLLAGHVAALILFIVASLTDWLDGLVARKYNLVTTFGRLFDPIADKILIATAFIAFVELKIFPAWMIIIILAREFLVTGLRIIGIANNRVIAADKLGKHKTLSQVITIILALAFITTRDILIVAGKKPLVAESSWEFASWSLLFLKVLLVYCVILTVYSGAMYLYKNSDLLKED
ncbi:MAG: CDP-diacylglycerol--glycerol-3-phosphate 3-phosphatidyltransferase, partial [Deltaproteobacteria bacterium]|nr:CDP-diacylglycerol--glycerol-3-phosphate 3-phosphatidyltransferase [Deltaproteobacteria bacterium]